MANVSDWSANELENLFLDDMNLSDERGRRAAKIMAAVKAKEDEQDAKLDAVAGGLVFRGTKATYADLEAVDSPAVGDMYSVTALDGANYAWDGTSWDDLGTNDANVVHKTGDETIAGEKVFTSPIDGMAKGLSPVSLGSDYEMNAEDFADQGIVAYSVTSFKADTSSAPTGNVGDYTLIRIYQGVANYACFLCRSPRDKQLFMGGFWNGTWSGWSEVLCTSSNAFFEAGVSAIGKTTDDESLYLVGASSITKGAFMVLNGENLTDYEGRFAIHAQAATLDKVFTGRPDGTLLWNGQAIQTSSDERLKTPISDIPDEVLDAWGDVHWGQFQYLEAVAQKGGSARLHLGLIAQQIKAVFNARGLDACAYGILCHEENAETDSQEASDVWMVRYDEAHAMEAAYQRRRAGRLESRIEALEAMTHVID